MAARAHRLGERRAMTRAWKMKEERGEVVHRRERLGWERTFMSDGANMLGRPHFPSTYGLGLRASGQSEHM